MAAAHAEQSRRSAKWLNRVRHDTSAWSATWPASWAGDCRRRSGRSWHRPGRLGASSREPAASVAGDGPNCRIRPIPVAPRPPDSRPPPLRAKVQARGACAMAVGERPHRVVLSRRVAPQRLTVERGLSRETPVRISTGQEGSTGATVSGETVARASCGGLAEQVLDPAAVLQDGQEVGPVGQHARCRPAGCRRRPPGRPASHRHRAQLVARGP